MSDWITIVWVIIKYGSAIMVGFVALLVPIYVAALWAISRYEKGEAKP